MSAHAFCYKNSDFGSYKTQNLGSSSKIKMDLIFLGHINNKGVVCSFFFLVFSFFSLVFSYQSNS